MDQRNTGAGPSPENILRISTGHWAAQILSSAVHFDIFTHLEAGPADAGDLARRANISSRGAQALLDGALGLGLVSLSRGKYGNTDEASTFLVQGKPTFLGFAGMAGIDWQSWTGLNAAIKRGGTPLEVSSYEQEELACTTCPT